MKTTPVTTARVGLICTERPVNICEYNHNGEFSLQTIQPVNTLAEIGPLVHQDQKITVLGFRFGFLRLVVQ